MILLTAAAVATAQPAQPAASLDSALTRIRRNVEAFQQRLPDFVCREKITSRTEAENDGRVESETIIESDFTGRQERSLIKGIAFSERRQIEKVNGAQWKSKDMPKGVFLLGGGYGSVLISVFGPKAEGIYEFSIPAGDQGGPPGAFVVAFETTNKKQKVKGTDGAYSAAAEGRAWFDPASFEILRLEQRIRSPKGEGEDLLITVDYRAVPIAESTFWMPARVSATARRTLAGRGQRGVYVAEYTEYRKYGASSTVEYQDPSKSR
jgi:hypothetical protein